MYIIVYDGFCSQSITKSNQVSVSAFKFILFGFLSYSFCWNTFLIVLFFKKSTAKVPFPLTFRFKPMLQRGVELITLDASWYADYLV